MPTEEIDRLKDTVSELSSSLTLLVQSHAEMKSLMKSVSNSMSQLVEIQIHTQNNSKNITKAFDKIEEMKHELDGVKSSIYQSCDTKTKEIDLKIKESKEEADKVFDNRINTLASIFDRRNIIMYGLIGGMFGLFISAVVYMNSEHAKLHEKINKINESVIANSTKVDRIHSTLEQIDKKLDKATAQRYKLAESQR